MNKKTISSLRLQFVVLVFSVVCISCKEEVSITFYEDSIETSEYADIAINIPKASGTEAVAKRINTTIKNYIIVQSNFTETSISELSVPEALDLFNEEYKSFITDFPESTQKWEYFVDGEVIYYSDQLLCIALTTYLDTGGAHGNTNVKFFNFKPESGEEFTNKELISNSVGLSEIIQHKLLEILKSDDMHTNMNDVFFGNDFVRFIYNADFDLSSEKFP